MSKSSYIPWKERQVHYFADIMEFIGYGWNVTMGRDFDWLVENVKLIEPTVDIKFFMKPKMNIKAQEDKVKYS